MRLEAVVPAAGFSRRMGSEKTLLKFGEATVLGTVLTKLARAGVARPVVVLRPDLPEAGALARGLDARVVLNPHPEREMLESIRLGLQAIALDADAVFIWPADNPRVLLSTLRALAREGDRDRAVIPLFQGRRGHPLLLGTRLLPAVASIGPGLGLNDLWRRKPDVLVEVAVEDAGVLADLNTPEDYESA